MYIWKLKSWVTEPDQGVYMYSCGASGNGICQPLMDIYYLIMNDFWLWICFLAGFQSKSGLWIDDVRLSIRPSVNIWLTLVNLCV